MISSYVGVWIVYQFVFGVCRKGVWILGCDMVFLIDYYFSGTKDFHFEGKLKLTFLICDIMRKNLDIHNFIYQYRIHSLGTTKIRRGQIRKCNDNNLLLHQIKDQLNCLKKYQFNQPVTTQAYHYTSHITTSFP